MTVPEIWSGQNRGGKKKKYIYIYIYIYEREQNHIASPTGIANYRTIKIDQYSPTGTVLIINWKIYDLFILKK